MWKAPYRPRREISQTYNDGIVAVYSVTDAAEPGEMPRETLNLKIKLNYEERRLGITRYYQAQQNNVSVEKIVRVPRHAEITNQDVAITEDGKQYRIDMVQAAEDVFPPSYDLTLAKVTHDYEVPQ